MAFRLTAAVSALLLGMALAVPAPPQDKNNIFSTLPDAYVPSTENVSDPNANNPILWGGTGRDSKSIRKGMRLLDKYKAKSEEIWQTESAQLAELEKQLRARYAEADKIIANYSQHPQVAAGMNYYKQHTLTEYGAQLAQQKQMLSVWYQNYEHYLTAYENMGGLAQEDYERQVQNEQTWKEKYERWWGAYGSKWFDKIQADDAAWDKRVEKLEAEMKKGGAPMAKLYQDPVPAAAAAAVQQSAPPPAQVQPQAAMPPPEPPTSPKLSSRLIKLPPI